MHPLENLYGKNDQDSLDTPAHDLFLLVHTTKVCHLSHLAPSYPPIHLCPKPNYGHHLSVGIFSFDVLSFDFLSVDVLPVDIDEIVFPLKFDDWNGLLQHVFESDKTAEATIGSFSVRNAQFFKRQNFSQDFGPFGGKLLTAEIIERNVKLSKPGTRVKSFVNTQVNRFLF